MSFGLITTNIKFIILLLYSNFNDTSIYLYFKIEYTTRNLTFFTIYKCTASVIKQLNQQIKFIFHLNR